MKKKGFTLVEVLAVLVIMGVLMAVTIPSIINSLDKKKNREYEKIVEEIESSAKLYVTQNETVQQFLNQAGSINVSYNTLVSEGLINGNEMDPLTDEKWDENAYVTVSKEGSTLTATYVKAKPTPQIIISSSNIDISTDESYFEDKLIDKVKATDETGIDYRTALIYTCKVDSKEENCKLIKTRPGTYEITYALNYNGTKYTSTSKLTIK